MHSNPEELRMETSPSRPIPQPRQGRRRLAAVALLLVCAAVVAACGNSTSAGTSGGGGSSDFKVAMLLQGSFSDQTYNADAKRTADLIESELGVTPTVTQGVQLPNQTEVYGQFAREGYDLVIGWGGQFTEGAMAASEQFPDTQFLVVNSNAENGSNLSSMDEDLEQWHFVAGYVAGRLTKTGTVGFVGGQCLPATAAVLEGTRQGAEYADPSVKFLSTFTGDFEDPTKAQEAAQAMIDEGADVIAENLNNGVFGVIQAAKSNPGVKLILEWEDNHALAPEAIASDVLKPQGKLVVPLVRKAEKGTLGGKHYQYPLPANWGPAVVKTSLLPGGIYKEALKVQKQVASGEIKVRRVETCQE
jgi:basic membrane protein A and related proteins